MDELTKLKADVYDLSEEINTKQSEIQRLQNQIQRKRSDIINLERLGPEKANNGN